MTRHFEDTFDTEDVLLNGNPFQLMIIRDTDGNTFKKKIKSPHDKKFNLGDYIEWNGQIWLVTLIDSDEKTWNRGYMYQCSILLRWQNQCGEIIERYGYSEDFTKYSTGTFGNSTITVGEYQYGITLPVDDETKLIKRDKRFPIDIEGVEPPDVYKLTNRKILLTDDRSFGRGGILTWTLSFSEFNYETDKKIKLDNGTEVWICDYVNPPTYLPQSNHNIIRANIVGNSNLKFGFSRIYSVELSDENGNTIEWNNTLYKWHIVSDFYIEHIIDGNNISLLVDNENFIGSSFLLQIVKLDNSTILNEMKIIIVEEF